MMNLCWAFHLMWHHRVGPHISNNRILSDPENRASPLSGADSRALAPLRLSTLALCLSHALRHSWAAAWAGCNVRLLSDSLSHTHTPQPVQLWCTHPAWRTVLKLTNADSSPVSCHYWGSSALQSCTEPLKIDPSSHTVWAADREYWKLDTHTTDHQVNRMGN